MAWGRFLLVQEGGEEGAGSLAHSLLVVGFGDRGRLQFLIILRWQVDWLRNRHRIWATFAQKRPRTSKHFIPTIFRCYLRLQPHRRLLICRNGGKVGYLTQKLGLPLRRFYIVELGDGALLNKVLLGSSFEGRREALLEHLLLRKLVHLLRDALEEATFALNLRRFPHTRQSI